jgi:hypothetical protein
VGFVQFYSIYKQVMAHYKKTMTKNLFVLAISVLLSIHVGAQTFSFAKRFGGLGNDAGTSVVTDNQGNIFMTGYFSDTCWFDTTYVIANNNMSSFIAKLSPEGTVNWIKGFNGLNFNASGAICLDNSQNIYIAGGFQTSIDFGDTVLIGKGNLDVFIAKFSHDGDFKWAKAITGTCADYFSGLKYKNGFIYAAGSFCDSVSFDTINLISNGLSDIYVLKMDTMGNIVWVKKEGGSWDDYGRGIDVDASNNVFLSGLFSDTVSFGPFQLIAQGAADIFICKYSSNGTEQWVKQIGGPFATGAQCGAIAIDQNGSPYLIGRIRNDFSIDTNNFIGDRGFMLFKFDDNGNFQWLRQAYSSRDCAWVNITIDNFNDIYLSGVFQDSAFFDHDTLIGTGYNPYIACFARYTLNGNITWIVQTTTPMYSNPSCIQSYNDSTLITTGEFEVSIDFDSSTLTSAGDYDIFLAKLSKGINLGQNEIDNIKNNLILYPNPTDQFLNIELRNIKVENCLLLLYNSIGSLVYKGIMTDNKMTLDIGNLPTGLYLISIQTKNNCVTKKIIKE